MIFIYIYGTQEPERSMYERFLYKLLAERKPHQNISHKEMPSYDDHVKFVRSKPYKEWYLIYCDNLCVGSIYLSKQNEIGLFIFEEYQGRGLGTKAINDLIKLHPITLHANIAPNNYKSIAFFKKHGFHFYEGFNVNNKQYTYSKLRLE